MKYYLLSLLCFLTVAACSSKEVVTQKQVTIKETNSFRPGSSFVYIPEKIHIPSHESESISITEDSEPDFISSQNSFYGKQHSQDKRKTCITDLDCGALESCDNSRCTQDN